MIVNEGAKFQSNTNVGSLGWVPDVTFPRLAEQNSQQGDDG